MSFEELAQARRQTTFAMLQRLAPAIRRGAVEILPPTTAATKGRTFRSQLLRAEESLASGHLLTAWESTEQLARRTAAGKDTELLLQSIKRRIGEAAEAFGLSSQVILELAIPSQDLDALECSSQEGLVLSCIDGRDAVAAILDELPGDSFRNKLLLIDLVNRGLVRARRSS
jgi:hypothetical protein